MDTDDTRLGETRPGVRQRAPQLAAGARLGRFVLLEPVGAGAMGVVFAAYDAQLDRKVAIKVVDEERLGRGSSGRARLLREARALAQISHPNVVVVHEAGEHDGRVWLAMEFVDGVTLRSWCVQQRSLREIIACYTAAARGLAAVHRAGMIHRDFKPDNVMLSGERVLVMDFGLASDPGVRADLTDPTGPQRARGQVSSDALTATGTILGTPRYMSPEQWASRELDARSDQFAFCVALFEALHGVPPFAGETIADLARAVEHGEVRRDMLRTDVPAWVQRVVMRGLQHDARDRFRDMDELVAALGRDPTRRRRGVALVAATLAVAGGAWASARWLEQRDRDDCVDAVANELATAWNPDARARVDAAFRATASRSAPDTAPRVATRLDRVTARLHELASASCDRPAPEPTHECFARVGVEIDELVEVFEHADADVVRSAISAIDGITPPDECIDRALAAELAEPAAPIERDAARALRRRIARISRRAAPTRQQEALVEADRVVAEAERLGDRPTLAEALLARANVRRRTDDLDASVADGERALQIALASRHDVGAVEAAEHLAWVVGYLREDVANGRHWLGIARALFERLPGAQQLRGAKLESTEGQIAWAAGEYERAAQHHRRVVEAFVAEVGEQDLRVGGALQHLGEATLELGQFDDALAHLERALAIRTAELGEVHPLVAISLAAVGTAHLKRRELDLAEQFYRRALEIRMATANEGDVALARDWGNIANVLAERGRYHEAIAAYENALRIKEAKLGRDDVSVALTLLNLGRVRHELDDDDGAEADYRRALAIRERVNGPDHPDVAVVLNNLALVLRTSDRAVESRAMLERVVEIRERALGRDHPMTASALGNLAVSYRDAGAYDRALTLYAESLATLERAHGHDSPALAHLLGDYGMAAFDSGDAARAAELVGRALGLLETAEPHGPLTAWTRFRLAQIRWQLGQHDEARALAHAALADVEENNRAEVDAWIAAHAVTAPGASAGGSR